MHIHTYFVYHLILIVVKCHACIPVIPREDVNIIEHIIHQFEELPNAPEPLRKVTDVLPVLQVFKKEVEKTNKKLISKTAEVAITTQPIKEFVAIFAGCRLNQIKFTSPETGRKLGKTIIPPDLSCSKTSLFGCQTASLTCNVPQSSKYPLISGFAKIDGADWATTDLKVSTAVFQLECDIYNRWTYVSDIPGLEGKVYATNEVSCLLVPIITESNSLEFEEDVEQLEISQDLNP